MDPTSLDHLSALMDGELGAEPARFLLRRMEHEPELARTWSRWHLIRACLNGERSAAQADPVRLASAATHDEDAFSTRVLRAVQARPQAPVQGLVLERPAEAELAAVAPAVAAAPGLRVLQAPLAVQRGPPAVVPDHLLQAMVAPAAPREREARRKASAVRRQGPCYGFSVLRS